METSEIVADYLRQRLGVGRNGIQWRSSPSTDSLNRVCVSMRIVCEEFRTQYEQDLENMIIKLPLNSSEATQKASFLSLANQLFVDGIQWSHIITLFVFAGELAAAYSERKRTDLIDSVAEWLTTYLNDHLKVWIEEHGGWVGLIQYQERAEAIRDPWPRLKNWMCGVAAAGAAVLTLGAFLTTRT